MSVATFHAVQDQGRRDYQEDNWAALPPRGDDDGLLLLVCDGMGGHRGGRLASETVCNSFAASFEAGTDLDIQSRFRRALDAAHEALAAAAGDDPLLSDLGTTLAAVFIIGDDLHWISVGDSPCYRVRRTTLERINADHSMAPVLDELVASGEMSAAEAASDPRRNALRSAVGTDDLSLIDHGSTSGALHPGDVLILASDGVDTLSPKTIRNIARKTYRKGPAIVADALLAGVLGCDKPHQDNVTIVVYIHDQAALSQQGLLARLLG